MSRSERFKMMDDMSLMSKKKLEIKAMARARMPEVSQQIDDTLNRVAALKEKMKGETLSIEQREMRDRNVPRSTGDVEFQSCPKQIFEYI